MADELYEGLTEGGCHFWNDVYPMFMARDLTRADLRLLIRKGLNASRGSYRGLLQLFGLDDGDYKRLLNFLAAHDCAIDFREFRGMKQERAARRSETPPRQTSGTSGSPAVFDGPRVARTESAKTESTSKSAGMRPRLPAPQLLLFKTVLQVPRLPLTTSALGSTTTSSLRREAAAPKCWSSRRGHRVGQRLAP